QVHQALSQLDHELAVVTDADAELDPSCIRELVRVLVHEPGTAIVGATIEPRTALLEERIHWWMLNRLWWLEGEALSSAMVSGSCFALRRKSVFPLCEDARMHDVNLALVASARGFRVRLCRQAVARDVRAPQNARDLVRFRLRRGRYYVSELRRSSDEPPGSPSWRLVHGIRLWHFLVSPALVTFLVVLGTGLLWTPAWPWPFATLAAFVAPAGTALLLSTSLRVPDGRPLALVMAAGRLVALTWFSLFALHRRAPAPSRGRSTPSAAESTRP
ncbi:MAG: glycosyltransferase family 2 protein, partial [Candidatus Binatia bacterium]